MEQQDKYHFISDNPAIYILTSRLESLFTAIDDEKNALYQIGNLISSIPPRLFTKYEIQELINKRDNEANKLLKELTNESNLHNEWSEVHKDQYIQQKTKEHNIETYQLIANKVTAIIDELYIAEEERKEKESHVRGII